MAQPGNRTGGLQTSALAVGLARASIDFIAAESVAREDLLPVVAGLRDDEIALVDDLLAVARGEGRCGARTWPRAGEQPGLAGFASGVGRRQKARLRLGASAGRSFRESAFLFGLELPAAGRACQSVRTGRLGRLALRRRFGKHVVRRARACQRPGYDSIKRSGRGAASPAGDLRKCCPDGDGARGSMARGRHLAA